MCGIPECSPNQLIQVTVLFNVLALFGRGRITLTHDIGLALSPYIGIRFETQFPPADPVPRPMVEPTTHPTSRPKGANLHHREAIRVKQYPTKQFVEYGLGAFRMCIMKSTRAHLHVPETAFDTILVRM